MSNVNIPEMTINKVVEELSKIYVPLIRNSLPYNSIPSPFLWGPPGVGKSDAVRELAEVLEERTGKQVVVTDIRLLLFSPIDLRGVPVADATKTFTDWLKPRILDLDSSENVVNLLFLDELSAAPQSVQAAAYQLTLNRAIGEHRLPENTLVLAAGNRTTDKAVAFKMPSALANRMMHFEITVDFKSWSQWAIHNNVHSMVLGYLSFASDKLHQGDKNLEDLAFPTPRSWMFVSNILNMMEDTENLDQYLPLIAGCIGMGNALAFLGYCKVYSILPKIEDIFEGQKVSDFPNQPDVLYALISSMTSYVISIEGVNKKAAGEDSAGEFAYSLEGLSQRELDNVCEFCQKLPPDFAACFFMNILSIDSVRLKLMKCSSFITWTKQHKKSLTMAGFKM